MILNLRKRDHITPALKALHWLPVEQRIQYKHALYSFKRFHSLLPPYLVDILPLYTDGDKDENVENHSDRTLRSASDLTKLKQSRFSMETVGKRAFSKVAPAVWNKLPRSLRDKSSVSSFNSGLKTHLFHCNFS